MESGNVTGISVGGCDLQSYDSGQATLVRAQRPRGLCVSDLRVLVVRQSGPQRNFPESKGRSDPLPPQLSDGVVHKLEQGRASTRRG